MVLRETSPFDKLQVLPGELEELLNKPPVSMEIPLIPGRDVEVRAPQALPARAGLSSPLGQRRLLHDLANIELQAMELGLRTLYEFPSAPKAFRAELAEVVRDEGDHLRLCLQGLEAVGGFWGEFPVHLTLWQAVSAHDSLLERVLIVHRYLEGSGLDSGDHLLRKLSGVTHPLVKECVTRILTDEVRHVAFGSFWYHQLCRDQQVDGDLFFQRLLPDLKKRLPRTDKLATHLRVQAGFTAEEMSCLQESETRQTELGALSHA